MLAESLKQSAIEPGRRGAHTGFVAFRFDASGTVGRSWQISSEGGCF